MKEYTKKTNTSDGNKQYSQSKVSTMNIIFLLVRKEKQLQTIRSKSNKGHLE